MRLEMHKFRRWLEAKPKAEIVGEQRDCHGCPIAKFYHDATKGHEVVIFENGERYMIDRGYSTKPLPWWANRFAFTVDGDANGQISAGRALEILSRI